MKNNSVFKKIFFCLFMAGIAVALTFCSSSAMSVNVNSDGVAVKGYDPVAYFTIGKPVKGNKKFEYEWKKAKWQFSSKEHRKLFMGAPEKYAPQFGGY